MAGLDWRIIRPLNVFLIAFSIIIVEMAILFSGSYDIPLKNLILILIATFTSLAAGNIINDIYDISADKINKPKKIYINNKSDLRIALRYYYLLVFISTLATVLTFDLFLFLLFGVVNFILYLYTRYFKTIPLLSNILIAILCAGVLLLPYYIHFGIDIENAEAGLYLAGLAFLLILSREIIKDLEDIKGDYIAGYKTIATVGRTGAAKAVILFCHFIILLASVWLFFALGSTFFKILLLFLLIFPDLALIIFTFTSKRARSFSISSAVHKGLMFSGLILFFLYFLL